MDSYRIENMTSFINEGIKNLFIDAGWESYLKRIEDLGGDIAEKSLCMYGAYIDDKLVGFVRAVGDGMTIIYIQDIIVLSSYKRRGIGRELVNLVINEYIHVRQKVLITDNNEEAVGFYKSIGFTDANEMGIVAFLRFEK